MMRLDRIYTKVGDKGQTLLASGQKVPKSSPRIEAYGTVDELNSHVGLLRDMVENEESLSSWTGNRLAEIQNELFDLGGELATPDDVLDVEKQQVVTSDSIEALESSLDEMNNALEPLANFVLPGGHPCVSQSHICRCVCRRAERRVVELASSEKIRDEATIYLNRLSDWLFVFGRAVGARLDVTEILWKQNRN